MRHKVHTHSFNRRGGPRKALIKGLVISLVEHGRIRTTLAKAKELKRHVERAVTIGKKGGVQAQRLIASRFGCEDTARELVKNVGPRFKTRNGGYTRILKLNSRAGDNAPMAFIEFVDYVAPKAADETTVKADVGAVKRAKQLSRVRAAHKKSLRQMKSDSRRQARA
jgi:large subunit ribosomal protein L17